MKPFLLAVLFLGVFAFQPARSQDSTRPAVGGVSSPANAMIFYLAHGPSGACGPNCSEWIAAEGTVQWDTYKRLLALLDRLGDRTPVVVFNVWAAGDLKVATAIGRIIRERGLDVECRIDGCFAMREHDRGGMLRAQAQRPAARGAD